MDKLWVVAITLAEVPWHQQIMWLVYRQPTYVCGNHIIFWVLEHLVHIQKIQTNDK